MFKPVFTITPQLTNILLRLELLRQEIQTLPIIPTVLSSLRESARLSTIHYSTLIEGNRLTLEQVGQLINLGSTFPGRDRDQAEVLGYYAALDCVQKLASINHPFTEHDIQNLHALVMGGGKKSCKPTPYRDGQNAIYDGTTKSIVYLPPEAKDLQQLMSEFVAWINAAEKENIPCPLRAAIAHYQFVTIHPYFDGNGRTARLLATIILHRGGYDLNGIYSLEEYYAKNLPAYYSAISIGPSHNYYLGRAEADISSWINYFCQGMIDSFEKVKTHALVAYHKEMGDDKSKTLRTLDAKQQALIVLFEKRKIITTKDIGMFFGISPRAAHALCVKWLANGFLVLKDSAKKSRSYELNLELQKKLFVI